MEKDVVHFREEPMGELWEEFWTLAQRHWQETEGHIREELNPRKEAYLRYSELGVFFAFTSRNEEGKLVGYCGMYIMPSMHTGKMVAREDFWYIAPEYRKGFHAIRFIRFVERALKEKGAVCCHISAKLANGAGRILEYMKYKNVSALYFKRLT